MQIPLRWRDVLEKKEETEKKEEGPLAKISVRARTDNPVNAFKKRAAVAHNFENFRYSYNYGRTNRDPDTSSMYHVANIS